MAELDNIQDFNLALHAAVREKSRIDGRTTLECFADEFLSGLAEVGAVSEPVVCYWKGGHARGAYEIHGYEVRHDDDAIDAFISIYRRHGQPESVGRSEVKTALNKLGRVLAQARSGFHTEMEPSSESFEMVRAIHEAVSSGYTTRMVLFTNGRFSSDRLEPDQSPFDGAMVEFWDAVRLFRASQANQETEIVRIDLSENPVPCVAMEVQPDEYQAYLAIMPGYTLYELYEKYGGRLMELNVRSYLQARGKVNRGIRDTLANEPARFMAYNNGISATVHHLDTVRLGNGTLAIRAMSGLQVVNGGQTTASIHRAVKHDKLDVSAVMVPMKITVLREDQHEVFVPLISRYANTQNVIQMADFSANDALHVELERMANMIWCPGERKRWFYERARGSYHVEVARAGTPAQQKKFKNMIPPANKLAKTDVARCLVAWDQRPFQVCKGAQKNFVEFMDQRSRSRVFSAIDERFFKNVVAKHLLFVAARKAVRVSGVEAYRAQVAAYIVSFLAFLLERDQEALDFRMIWDEQGLSEELEELLLDWAVPMRDLLVEISGTRNVTEVCKKQECWEAVIERAEMPWPEDYPEEVIDRTSGDEYMREAALGDEEENRSRVMNADPAVWEQIARWGAETGRLTGRQQQISHTLARQAMEGWRRLPRSQQVTHGVALLRLWDLEG